MITVDIAFTKHYDMLDPTPVYQCVRSVWLIGGSQILDRPVIWVFTGWLA